MSYDPDLIPIPGGTFTMGSDDHYPEEAPAHRVSVEPFALCATAVTNRDFAQFVAETGYRTVAERPLEQVPPGKPVRSTDPGSWVFTGTEGPVALTDFTQWWRWTPGASWRHPEGPASDVTEREFHPVVHIAHEDASAFAQWAGLCLPTEAQWEYAARGGIDGAEFAWGEELYPGGRLMANTWVGQFPWENLSPQNAERTCEVGTFPANRYGLFEMIGNVWEWTSDPYEPGHSPRPGAEHSCCGAPNDPTGPNSNVERAAKVRVCKGGSFLCAPSYCRRYRPASRLGQPVDSGASHIGFRCASSTLARH